MKLLFTFLLTCGASLDAAPTWDKAVDWNKAVDAAEELHHQGKFAEARKVLLAAMDTARFPGQMAVGYNNLGAIAQDQGKYVDAGRYYRQSIRQWESVPGAEGMMTAMNNLATLMYASGRLDAADRILRRAELLQIETTRRNSAETAFLIQNRAIMYFRRGQYEKAEVGFRQALGVWSQTNSGHDLEIAAAFRGLAIICSRTDRGSEAALLNARAMEIWSDQVASGFASAEVRAALSRLYLEKKMPLEAEPILKEAVRLSEVNPDYPLLLSILRMYATVLHETGHKVEAREIEARATQIARGCSQICAAQLTIDATDLVANKQTRLR